MYKICQTEQSYKRQRSIEQGLLHLMHRSRYEDISISDLCAHLQIPRKTFYRYFSGKDGCLYAMLDHTMMDFQMADFLPSPSIRSTPGDLTKYFYFWHNNKDLLTALDRSNLNGLLVERATFFALQEKMMPRYMLKWEQSMQQLAMSFTISGLMSMVLRWHQQGYLLSPEEMSLAATQLLTNPLISR